MPKHLGQLSDIEIVSALIDVHGLHVLDVGCGPGATARLLVERGATVVGLEPDPVQVQRNREAERFMGLTLMEGRAEALPQEDSSVDGVFFFRSLHHVPAGAMDCALEEARRVVRAGGFVFALEPSVEGSHTAMMLPFHDEREVRALAQEALARAAARLFTEHERYVCVQQRRYAHFDEMVARFSAMSFNGFTPEMIDVPAVRASFAEGRIDEGYLFDQQLLIDVFRVG